mmetsp:Transcript_5604/g.9199  ORF Transcript_5604/g.9199 Transcript_5604/m.9199 type:complete len:82 (+) Transcript_5604:601-846(+)
MLYQGLRKPPPPLHDRLAMVQQRSKMILIIIIIIIIANIIIANIIYLGIHSIDHYVHYTLSHIRRNVCAVRNCSWDILNQN